MPKSLRLLPLLILAVTGCQKQNVETQAEQSPPLTTRGVRNGGGSGDRAVGALVGAAGICSGLTLCVSEDRSTAVVLSSQHCPHANNEVYTVDSVVKPGSYASYGLIKDRVDIGSIRIPSEKGTDGFRLFKIQLQAGKGNFDAFPYLSQDYKAPLKDAKLMIKGYGEALVSSPGTRREGSIKADGFSGPAAIQTLADPNVGCNGDSGGPIFDFTTETSVVGVHISGRFPDKITAASLSQADRCRAAIGGNHIQVAPFVGAIMDAANQMVPQCILYEPSGADQYHSVKIALEMPYGSRAKGVIELVTDPQGQYPEGDHCRYTFPGRDRDENCVEETLFNGVRRTIKFEAKQVGLSDEMLPGYWVINNRRYDGAVANFDYLGSVNVEGVYHVELRPTYTVHTNFNDKCLQPFIDAGSYIDDSAADPMAMADQIECLAGRGPCWGDYLAEKGMSLTLQNPPSDATWKWVSMPYPDPKCPCEGSTQRTCKIPGQKARTNIWCRLETICVAKPPPPMPPPPPAPPPVEEPPLSPPGSPPVSTETSWIDPPPAMPTAAPVSTGADSLSTIFSEGLGIRTNR